jgi:hypothetical protein
MPAQEWDKINGNLQKHQLGMPTFEKHQFARKTPLYNWCFSECPLCNWFFWNAHFMIG